MNVLQPRIQNTGIILKSVAEIDLMRQAGKVVARTITVLLAAVRPGISTAALDAIAEEHIRASGATPSFKGYRGFPASICTSINEEVVHGIPGKRTVRAGDILKLDVGAIVEGFHGDSAITIPVGAVSAKAETLIDACAGSLNAAIALCKVGKRIGDLSNAAQTYAESRGFSVVREYVGHGIGRQLHEEPAVPNYGVAGKGIVLQHGMVLAIEPMVNVGTWKTYLMPDNWTVVTEDRALSAHFEHTIAILDTGPEVLTAR